MFFGGVGACGCAPSIAGCASFDMVCLLHVQVEPIVQSVRERGDAAVKEFTEKFDRATVDTVCVRIEVRILPLDAIWRCCGSDPAPMVTLSWTSTALLQDLPEPQLDAESAAAFDTAFNNIRAFHDAQQAAPLEVETMPGVRCRRVTRPIGRQPQARGRCLQQGQQEASSGSLPWGPW